MGTRKTRRILNDSVWGKNPELEHFWRELASGKKVIIMYKDKTHAHVNLPSKKTKKYTTMFTDFYENPSIIAILSSNPSQDAYEQYLYPKAKTKSVGHVISHYTTFFKPILPGDKLRVPL